MLWIMVLGAACVVLGIFNAVWGFVEALMLPRPAGRRPKRRAWCAALCATACRCVMKSRAMFPKWRTSTGAALQPTVHMAFSVSRRR